MGVYVFNKFKNYTIISNLVLTDENLSLEEKGLFCYLFSKPDGWEFHYNAMKKELQEKSDKTIRKILNRLVETGYITKCQVNSTNGHFGGISIKFTDKSFVQQNSKNTDCPNLPFGENTDCLNLPYGKNGESVKMPSNNTYNNNNNYINAANHYYIGKDRKWRMIITADQMESITDTIRKATVIVRNQNAENYTCFCSVFAGTSYVFIERLPVKRCINV